MRLASLLKLTLVALLLPGTGAGCRSRGTITLALKAPSCGRSPTGVRMLIASNASCSGSSCDPLPECHAPTCAMACPETNGVCPIEALDRGLSIPPPAAGRYLVRVILLSGDGSTPDLGTSPDNGTGGSAGQDQGVQAGFRMVTDACGEVEVQANGVEDGELQLQFGKCCQ